MKVDKVTINCHFKGTNLKRFEECHVTLLHQKKFIKYGYTVKKQKQI